MNPIGGAHGQQKPFGSNLMEILFFAGALVLWFALQMWILPSLGVPT